MKISHIDVLVTFLIIVIKSLKETASGQEVCFDSKSESSQSTIEGKACGGGGTLELWQRGLGGGHGLLTCPLFRKHRLGSEAKPTV